MQSDSEQLDQNSQHRLPAGPDWVDICATFAKTVLVFERVTDFVSTSQWASNTGSIFESRTHEAQARLAHLRAAVPSLSHSRATDCSVQSAASDRTPQESDTVAEEMATLDTGAASAQNEHARFSAEPSLTAREREVAILIAKGRSNRQIAEALVLVPGTVANHVAHILGKLDCANRAQVAAWAVRNGLLNEDSFD